MSTLAAAKADSFYYPPDWDPSKGSLNKFHGSHGALGDRARKLHEGILIIRFEMPFNVWCAGCGHLIGKGVRFNAEKKQIGMYHSTKVWSFSMRSPCCKTRIEVHTDPKNAEYVVVAGARRKVETFDAAAAGTAELDPEARERLADPFAKLEHVDEDKRRARESHQQISALRQDTEAKHRDDYALNKQLRAQLRAGKKEERANDEQRRQLGLPDHIRLLPESGRDALAAAAVDFGGQRFQHNWRHSRRGIASSSIFSPQAVAAAAAAAPRRGGASAAAGAGAGRRQQGGGAAAAPPAAAGPQQQNGGQQQSKKRRLDAAVKLRLSEPGKRGKS